MNNIKTTNIILISLAVVVVVCVVMFATSKSKITTNEDGSQTGTQEFFGFIGKGKKSKNQKS